MEHRAADRLPTGIIVQYRVNGPSSVSRRFGGLEKEAIANDLSAGGLSLYTDFELPAGTEIVMRLRLSSRIASAGSEMGSRKMELYGEVRHSKPTDDRATYLAGIRFVRISAADQAFIAARI